MEVDFFRKDNGECPTEEYMKTPGSEIDKAKKYREEYYKQQDGDKNE